MASYTIEFSPAFENMIAMHEPIVSRTESCSEALLARFLDGKLDADERAAFESHLNTCLYCREELAQQAAEPDFWEIASLALDTQGEANCTPLPTQLLDLDNLTQENLGIESNESYSLAGSESFLQQWLAPSSDSNSIGRIRDYEVLEVIGRGGMGLVLRAFDPVLNRKLAVKTLLQHLSHDPSAKQRLLREAQAAASLHHPHVTPIFSIETWRDVPLIVMPYVEGGTLYDHASRKSLSVDEILMVAHQVAQALSAAHEIGLIHRDIKPSNILLEDGLTRIQLSDFGLARVQGDLTITESGILAGTPQFMSPEQAEGRVLDSRSDLFSLGSLLYWLATGKYPFQAESSYGVILKLVHDEPTPLAELNPTLPPYLQQLIRLLMAKRPGDRFQDADAVAHLLEACIAHRENPADSAIPERLTKIKPQQTKKLVASKARLALGVVALLCMLYLLASISSNPDTKSAVVHAMSVEDQTKEQHDSSGPTLRYGELDDSDLLQMQSDLTAGDDVHYWLRRLAYLDVSKVPPEAIPYVQKFADSSDPTTRELALVTLRKNPFELVMPYGPSQGESLGTKPEEPVPENPFVEIE